MMHFAARAIISPGRSFLLALMCLKAFPAISARFSRLDDQPGCWCFRIICDWFNESHETVNQSRND